MSRSRKGVKIDDSVPDDDISRPTTAATSDRRGSIKSSRSLKSTDDKHERRSLQEAPPPSTAMSTERVTQPPEVRRTIVTNTTTSTRTTTRVPTSQPVAQPVARPPIQPANHPPPPRYHPSASTLSSASLAAGGKAKTTYLPFFTEKQYREEARLSNDNYLQRLQHGQLKLLVEMKQWRDKLFIPDEEVRAEAEHLLQKGIIINPTEEGLPVEASRELETKRLEWQNLELDQLLDLVNQVD